MPLLAQFNEHAKLSMLRNATWTLSNFCRGKPQPQFEQTKPALPALARLIHSNDEEVLTDACWALSYLSDGTNDKIQAVNEAGVYPRSLSFCVLIPALRTVGDVTGDDIQTQGSAARLLLEATVVRKNNWKPPPGMMPVMMEKKSLTPRQRTRREGVVRGRDGIEE
ncbi:hypothetical protein RHMOL_Rhmol07G0000600 [Rhododendron molle]|nr:hypothetical protein RHMOL_Rhmol07G0000600 [Rhododendron molle]KAI8544889.1 hypothetical protein RHMOL_Rhmol07G0000600 [Rhododendron molle]